MSKSSTVTVRETPVEKVASATAGGFVIHGENFVIDTDDRIELVDLTDRVMNFVRQFKIREGMITLWSMHTTCAVFINEFQRASIATFVFVVAKANPTIGYRQSVFSHRLFIAFITFSPAGQWHPPANMTDTSVT